MFAEWVVYWARARHGVGNAGGSSNRRRWIGRRTVKKVVVIVS